MNSGPTSERVYEALKARILARGYRPGERLDPAVLSAPLNASVTPVRDALNTMKGEGLVEARTSEGFYLPQADAPGLRDLYRWNEEVLRLAIRSWPHGSDRPRSAAREPLPENDPPAAAAALFAGIGSRSVNVEHGRAIASANDRLNAVRWAEALVLDGVQDELAELSRSVVSDAAVALRGRIAAYHRRRLRAADDIVRALYRNGLG